MEELHIAPVTVMHFYMAVQNKMTELAHFWKIPVQCPGLAWSHSCPPETVTFLLPPSAWDGYDIKKKPKNPSTRSLSVKANDDPLSESAPPEIVTDSSPRTCY